MALADTFQEIVDSLPDDWTDLELDLRIFDETRYVDAAAYLRRATRSRYSKHDWHWRILVAHRFGHAAARARGPQRPAAARPGRDRGRAGPPRGPHRPRVGRPDWGRPESVRQEFARIFAPVAVARVAALVPDLLFGSKVQAALSRPATRSTC